MRAEGRRVVAAVVLGIVAASFYIFLTGEPSWRFLLYQLVMIAFWWPLKGALLRFLGGFRPYRSALAANASSELTALGFSVARLGMPWPALLASLGASTVIEGLTLTAMRTAATARSFAMSLYANIVVHVLTAGMLLWPREHWIAAGLFLGGFLLFILPIFVVDRPLGAPVGPPPGS